MYNRDVSRAINPETFTVDPSLDQTTMSTTSAQLTLYVFILFRFLENYKLCSVHFKDFFLFLQILFFFLLFNKTNIIYNYHPILPAKLKII